MFRNLILSAPLLVAASIAQAVDAPPAMRAFVESDVMGWANSAQVIDAINAQNTQTAGASEAQIIEWDNDWRSQVGQSDQPLISDSHGYGDYTIDNKSTSALSASDRPTVRSR